MQYIKVQQILSQYFLVIKNHQPLGNALKNLEFCFCSKIKSKCPLLLLDENQHFSEEKSHSL